MKLQRLLITSLFLGSAIALQASVESVLKLELLCYTQKKTSASDTTERGSVDRFRVNSKDLLRLISKQLATRFPSGSKLQVAVDGSVYVADSKGKWLGEAIDYLKLPSVIEQLEQN
jgi:hypothetical protein